MCACRLHRTLSGLGATPCNRYLLSNKSGIDSDGVSGVRPQKALHGLARLLSQAQKARFSNFLDLRLADEELQACNKTSGRSSIFLQ